MTLVNKGGDQKIEKTGLAKTLRAAFKAKKDSKNLEQTDITSQDILPNAVLDVTKVEDFEEPPLAPLPLRIWFQLKLK